MLRNPSGALGAESDVWKPPGGYDNCSPWALDNRVALETYAQGIHQHGTAADQLQQFILDASAVW